MNESLDIPIRILNDDASIPRYAHDGDAGVDLCSCDDVILKPLARTVVHCGFSLAIPRGYAGLVLPRSGLATNHGITVPNSPGLIDSGYRGEMMVSLINLSDTQFHIEAGMRVAQLLIVQAAPIRFITASFSDKTERGTGGFGSSGIS